MKISRNPITLPGSWDNRVFISGKLELISSRLNDICKAVKECGLNPINIMDYIQYGTRRNISTELIQECKYAIFETSRSDRTLFDLDNAQKYSVLSLCLWDNSFPRRSKLHSSNISSHPIFIKNHRPYSDSRSLEREVFIFFQYDPYAHRSIGAVRVYLDDIDTFNKIERVENNMVTNIVPLPLSEKLIKDDFAQIIGEPFVSNDWGGETCDLITTIKYHGKRLSSGFIFKGPGLANKFLTISKLGKNGDQIVRLTSISLDFYAVQFVRAIDQSVIKHLEGQVELEAQRRRKLLLFCIIDGTFTARLLKAYGKI